MMIIPPSLARGMPEKLVKALYDFSLVGFCGLMSIPILTIIKSLLHLSEDNYYFKLIAYVDVIFWILVISYVGINSGRKELR